MVSCNAAKRDALRKSLERQQKKNESVDRHRSHVVASAGLIGDASNNDLAKSTSDFVNSMNEEIEKLTIEIVHAKQQYTTDLNTYSTELKKCCASTEDINSLDVTRC